MPELRALRSGAELFPNLSTSVAFTILSLKSCWPLYPPCVSEFAVEGTHCPVTDRCSGSTVRHTRARPNPSCLITTFHVSFYSPVSLFSVYHCLDDVIIASPPYICFNMVKGHTVGDPNQSGEFLNDLFLWSLVCVWDCLCVRHCLAMQRF